MILSCLVWMYADQINNESVVEFVSLQISPQSGSDLIVELQDPPTGQFQVTFSGPHAEVENLRKDLGTGKFKPLYYVQPEDVKSESLIKSSAEVIGSFLRKDYKTISVQDVKPAQLKIYVDKLITVPMPVTVSTGATKTTRAVVTPGEVKVTLSSQAYNSLNDVEKFIVIDIENELRNKPENLELNEDFPLPQVVLGQPVTTDPTRVNIQLRVQQQFKTTTLQITKINRMIPGDLESKYRVDIRNESISVELKGPAELIDNLDPKKITAYITIDKADILDRTEYFPRDVQFILPKGIQLNTDKMTLTPKVDFKLVELQSQAPSIQR